MKEIIAVLEDIHDTDRMKTFIQRQDFDGCQSLINALRYTSKETENRWFEIYTKTFKY